MKFENLDASTRSYMRSEVENDVRTGRLYMSRRFKPGADAVYPDLLLEAVDSGDCDSLAEALATANLFLSHEVRNTKNGPVRATVPDTAPQTFAEGEFNRFYIRAVCLRALERGQERVTIYRAKDVSSPRPESEAVIGTTPLASDVLDVLRSQTDVNAALGLPPGPNSGISVRL